MTTRVWPLADTAVSLLAGIAHACPDGSFRSPFLRLIARCVPAATSQVAFRTLHDLQTQRRMTGAQLAEMAPVAMKILNRMGIDEALQSANLFANGGDPAAPSTLNIQAHEFIDANLDRSASSALRVRLLREHILRTPQNGPDAIGLGTRWKSEITSYAHQSPQCAAQAAQLLYEDADPGSYIKLVAGQFLEGQQMSEALAKDRIERGLTAKGRVVRRPRYHVKTYLRE